MSDTPRMMYGFTKEQWMDPARLAEKAQKEWNEFFAKQDAFEAVQNKENWKFPIDAIIDEKDRKITQEAIQFFAGGGVKFFQAGPGKLRVTAPGYYKNGF